MLMRSVVEGEVKNVGGGGVGRESVGVEKEDIDVDVKEDSECVLDAVGLFSADSDHDIGESLLDEEEEEEEKEEEEKDLPNMLRSFCFHDAPPDPKSIPMHCSNVLATVSWKITRFVFFLWCVVL